MDNIFVKTEFQQKMLQKIENLIPIFRKREPELDHIGNYPYKNINDLKNIGYTQLTIPKEYGGSGISLYDMILFQENIARGSGPTALSIGWHVGVIFDIASKKSWDDEELFSWFCEEIKKGSITNRAASEFATGSPTRGGRFQTIAVDDGDHYIINGSKAYTTLSPMLDYFLVTAMIDDYPEACELIVPKDTMGLSIDETSWDSLSMRGTASHVIYLKDVRVPKRYRVTTSKKQQGYGSGWLLHIPACYLGIAQGAFEEAVAFAKYHQPNSLPHPICELPHIKHKLGEIQLLLMQTRHFLYSVCEKYDAGLNVSAELGAVKHTVTNNAITIVDKAMRIVGAKSLLHENPLWRSYLNVRAGLHNPPMDDVVINTLASYSLDF